MARKASGIEILDQAKEIISKAKTVNELYGYAQFSVKPEHEPNMH